MDYRSEREYAQKAPEAPDKQGGQPSADEGRSARAQAEELRRQREQAAGAEGRVRRLLSYGAFDWTVSDKEALEALQLLSGLPEGSRRSVLQRLEPDGYVSRLLDNLPAHAMKSRGKQMLALYTALPRHVLVSRMESLLSTGLLDWGVSKDEAMQVAQILGALPPAARKLFIYRDGGKAYERLMKVLEPGKEQEKEKKDAGKGKEGDGAPGKELKPAADTRRGVARHEDDPGMLQRAWAGQKAARGVAGGDVDLQEVETVLGGEMGGIQLAERASEEENRLDLDLDWEKGFLIGSIASLNIAALESNAGDVTVATGAGRLNGLQVQMKWATQADPDSEMQLRMDRLALLDVQILAQELTVVIRSLALAGLEVFAAKPPDRSAKPTSRGEAFQSVRQQVSEVIGLALPSLASMRGADPHDPDSLVDRLKENFGGDLDLSLHMDDAQIRGVTTSDGDSMETMDVGALDVSVRQMSRVGELEAEAKRLELDEKDGKLDAAGAARLPQIRAELERIRPLEGERKRLLAKRKASGLSMEEQDRLVELDNELNQGVATIDLASLSAKGVSAKGQQFDSGEIEGLHARASGGNLNMRRQTRAEQLDSRLGAVLPGGVQDPARAPDAPQDSRAEVSVKRVSTQGYVGDQAALAEGSASDVKLSADGITDPSTASASLSVGNVSARELQTAQASVGSLEASGLTGAVDQKEQAARLGLEGAHATGIQAGGAQLDDVSVRDLSGRVTDYADPGQTAVKASLGDLQATGVRSDQGSVDQASLAGLRASAGPGLGDGSVEIDGVKASGVATAQGSVDAVSLEGVAAGADRQLRSAYADVGRAQVGGVRSDQGSLESATVEGVHVQGTDLLDGKARAGSASIERAEALGLQSELGSVDRAALAGMSAQAGPGLTSGSADLASLEVAGAKGDLGKLDRAAVSGVHVDGADLLDADKRALGASVETARVEGVEAAGAKAQSLEVKGIAAQSSRGEQDAGLSIDSVRGKGLAGQGASVGDLSVTGMTAAGTDLRDAEKRSLEGGIGAIDARDLRHAGPEGTTTVGQVGAQGVKGSFAGGRATADVERAGVVDAQHLGKGGQRQAKLGQASVSGVHLEGSGAQDYEAKVRSLEASGISGREGELHGSADKVGLQGATVRGDEWGTRAAVGKAEATGLQAGKGDSMAASAGAVTAEGLRADVSKEGQAWAKAKGAEVQDVRYRDADQSASVGRASVTDVAAKGLGASKGGEPAGEVSLGEALVEDVAVTRGDLEASVGSAGLKGVQASADGKGGVLAGIEGAGVRDVRAKKGDAASASVGSVDVGATQAALSGLGPGGKPSLDAAHTDGVSVRDVRAEGTPGKLAPKGGPALQPGPQALPKARTGEPAKGKSQALPQLPGQDKGEEFKADAFAGMSGTVHAELPVVKPIKTTITVDVPVDNGMVELSKIKLKGTGLLGSIGAATTDIVVDKRGALIVDVLGPWNVTVMEPGKLAGLISKKQGGGKHGTVALEALIEGLMNATVEEKGTGEEWPQEVRDAADKEKGKKKKKKGKKKGDEEETLPLALERTRIALGGLKLGEGRLGTETMGLTLTDGGEAGINRIEMDATLGDHAHLGTQGLHAEDVTALGPDGKPIRVEEVGVSGLNVHVDKPLDDQRKVEVGVDGVDVQDASYGDQEKLEALRRRKAGS